MTIRANPIHRPFWSYATGLACHPQRCALVGDAETDLQMALEAGIGGVIGFTGGWKRAPKLPSAQHLLHSWDHLSVSTNS